MHKRAACPAPEIGTSAPITNLRWPKNSLSTSVHWPCSSLCCTTRTWLFLFRILGRPSGAVHHRGRHSALLVSRRTRFPKQWREGGPNRLLPALSGCDLAGQTLLRQLCHGGAAHQLGVLGLGLREHAGALPRRGTTARAPGWPLCCWRSTHSRSSRWVRLPTIAEHRDPRTPEDISAVDLEAYSRASR
jgi:hypothetical protein